MEEMLEDRRGTTCRRRKIMVGAIAGVVLLVLLVVIGNVISIGDKILISKNFYSTALETLGKLYKINELLIQQTRHIMFLYFFRC